MKILYTYYEAVVSKLPIKLLKSYTTELTVWTHFFRWDWEIGRKLEISCNIRRLPTGAFRRRNKNGPSFGSEFKRTPFDKSYIIWNDSFRVNKDPKSSCKKMSIRDSGVDGSTEKARLESPWQWSRPQYQARNEPLWFTFERIDVKFRPKGLLRVVII